MPETRTIDVFKAVGEGPGRTELRVVQWGDRPPQLEKRQFIRDVDDPTCIRPGRLRGLSLEDVKFVVSNWPRVHSALQGVKE